MLAIARPIDDRPRERVSAPPASYSPRTSAFPISTDHKSHSYSFRSHTSPFLIAAQIWVVLNLLLYGFCVYLIWKSCPACAFTDHSSSCVPSPFRRCFISSCAARLPFSCLACFTAAFLAFRADRNWLAGIALGFLVFKPQFLVAIPLVLLLAQAWKALGGVVVAASAQLAFTRIYFGPAVMLRLLRYSLARLTRDRRSGTQPRARSKCTPCAPSGRC